MVAVQPNATLAITVGNMMPTFTAWRPNLPQLVSIFDWIFFMMYDMGQYNPGTAPAIGPNSALTGGQAIPCAECPGGVWRGSIEYAVNDSLAAGVPAEKIIVGVPWYGREWPTFGPTIAPLDRQIRTLDGVPGVNGSRSNSPGASWSGGVAVSSQDAEAHALASPWGRHWDADTQTPYYPFMDSWGTWGQGFYDDVQSLTLKYNWVKAQAPGMGVGVFAINYPLGGDKMWQALQTFSSSD